MSQQARPTFCYIYAPTWVYATEQSREFPSVQAAIDDADRKVEKHKNVSIRSDRTSDGTVWGKGRGRLAAVREYGRWRGL